MRRRNSSVSAEERVEYDFHDRGRGRGRVNSNLVDDDDDDEHLAVVKYPTPPSIAISSY